MHKYIDFKPGTRPKCRDLGEISAFGTVSEAPAQYIYYN